MSKFLNALGYVAGFVACVSVMTGFAFLFGYVTHTGLFA